jgi:hypothetical protein
MILFSARAVRRACGKCARRADDWGPLCRCRGGTVFG